MKKNYTQYHAYPARYGPSLVEGGEIFSIEADWVNWDSLYTKVE